MAKNDLRRKTLEIIREAQARGWVLVEDRKSNHFILRWPGGGPQQVTASTPSDWRGVRNFRARLNKIEREYPK